METYTCFRYVYLYLSPFFHCRSWSGSWKELCRGHDRRKEHHVWLWYAYGIQWWAEVSRFLLDIQMWRFHSSYWLCYHHTFVSTLKESLVFFFSLISIPCYPCFQISLFTLFFCFPSSHYNSPEISSSVVISNSLMNLTNSMVVFFFEKCYHCKVNWLHNAFLTVGRYQTFDFIFMRSLLWSWSHVMSLSWSLIAAGKYFWQFITFNIIIQLLFIVLLGNLKSVTFSLWDHLFQLLKKRFS